MSNKHYSNITLDAVEQYCAGTVADFTIVRLLDILTGETDLDEAREDALSFAEEEIKHTVYCSSCGHEFSLKQETGFSHCEDHKGVISNGR